MPFRKGQSGNPEGRPPLGDSIADALRDAGTNERRKALAEKAWELAEESDINAHALHLHPPRTRQEMPSLQPRQIAFARWIALPEGTQKAFADRIRVVRLTGRTSGLFVSLINRQKTGMFFSWARERGLI